MPSCEYFLACEDVVVDQWTNRMSVFNILEEISAPDFPASAGVVGVSVWRVDNDEEFDQTIDVELVIFADTERERAFPVRVVLNRARVRAIVKINNINFPEAGDVTIGIRIAGQPIAARHHVRAIRAAAPGPLPPLG